MYCQCKVRREADERRTILVLGQKGGIFTTRARGTQTQGSAISQNRGAKRNARTKTNFACGKESSINPNRGKEEVCAHQRRARERQERWNAIGKQINLERSKER